MPLEEHVFVRALALGLSNRDVLWGFHEHVSFRALALGLPNGEIGGGAIHDSERKRWRCDTRL